MYDEIVDGLLREYPYLSAQTRLEASSARVSICKNNMTCMKDFGKKKSFQFSKNVKTDALVEL